MLLIATYGRAQFGQRKRSSDLVNAGKAGARCSFYVLGKRGISRNGGLDVAVPLHKLLYLVAYYGRRSEHN